MSEPKSHPAIPEPTHNAETIIAALHRIADRPRSGKPVAWIVERDSQMLLPLLRSAEDMERYRDHNPEEHLMPLYAHPAPDRNKVLEALTRPIIGIEYRTAQEVFDIMANRAQAALKDQINDD